MTADLKRNASRLCRKKKSEKERDMVETEKIIEVVKRTKPFFRDREAVGNIRVKGLADYATQVDDGVQKFLAEELKKMYPDIGFLGEESYAGEQVSGRMWIVDPVDGTTNLIHHYRQSVVSVALASEGEIVLGIIYHPYTEELYCAEAGKGAYKNGVPIHVSPVKELSHSLIAVGTSPYYHEYAADNFAVFQKIFLQCEDIRRSGSAAFDLAHVAEGSTEAYFERNLKIWDYAAGLLLIREAGGDVTDYEGNPIRLTSTINNIVADNGHLGEEIRAIINE